MLRQSAARTKPRLAAAPAAALLAWYDANRRVLPWRALPGVLADPYAVWLSEVMLQQTTVAAVKDYYSRFLARWPTVDLLAAAPVEEVMRAWAGLGYYSRARNLHACAIKVAREHGGRFPRSETALRALPGIGAYTAAAIAAIAFDENTVVIDANIERILTRLFAIETPLPAAKPLICQLAAAHRPEARAGDYAQGMMDLGATICTPKRPACDLCPLSDGCMARQRGDPASFPRKAAKAVRPQRFGAAFYVRRAGGDVLVRTRPPKGLLGGMTEFPGSDWTPGYDAELAMQAAPPFGVFALAPAKASHVFTHFALELCVFTADVAAPTPAPSGHRWIAEALLEEEALPTLMRKVMAAARGETLRKRRL